MKLWTKILSLLMNIQVNQESVFHVFVHNFMFLSTFSKKLYEYLNMFIRIGHVSWHLLNMFLDIFVTILLFFISTNQNHFKKKKKNKLYYFQSQPKSTKLSKNIKSNKTFNFYYFQTLTKSFKPSQIQSNPNFKHQNFVIPKPK
jgi:hypothetical protein